VLCHVVEFCARSYCWWVYTSELYSLVNAGYCLPKANSHISCRSHAVPLRV
jgi:hypothetical protein